MFTKTFLAAAFATLASAAPAMIKRQSTTYYGVSLELRVDAPVNGGSAYYEPAPIEINQLTFLGNGTSVSEISFDPNIAINVDINSVECRAYKDAAGVVPGSAPFTNAQPAELSTNLVQIQSILCYITESS